jgi:hypothetical protein
MADAPKTISNSILDWWRVGTRVSRKREKHEGTIVELTGHMKVKWDNGQTSYYRPGSLSNVTLKRDDKA